MGLLLRAVEVAGPLRWRWLLTDEEHRASAGRSWGGPGSASDEVAAFGDVYGYVRSYAAPDRRTEDEARLVAGAGAWAGRMLLGEGVARRSRPRRR